MATSKEAQSVHTNCTDMLHGRSVTKMTLFQGTDSHWETVIYMNFVVII